MADLVPYGICGRPFDGEDSDNALFELLGQYLPVAQHVATRIGPYGAARELQIA